MVGDNQVDDRMPADNIPGFRFLRLAGEGGMGLVYLAEQREPIKRLVAIKIVKSSGDRQLLARFEAERQALALMDHPHIAHIYGAGQTTDGRPYVFMEWTPGDPITAYCQERGLDLPKQLSLFLQLCGAVQHAHQKAVIHRDLKPSNVLVSDAGAMPSVKVIDFGIAKAFGADVLTEKTLHTQLGQFLGTPAYASPEQLGLGSSDVDTRSDVYSLGAILYEMLTGTPPIVAEGESPWELQRRLMACDPERPSDRLEKASVEGAMRAVDLRGDLDWVVMKALSKDRERRYHSVAQLAEDVSHFLAHEPVDARPPSLWYQLGKFARRNRAYAAAAVLVTLSLLAGVVVSAWHAARATKAHREMAQSIALSDYQTGQSLAAQGDFQVAAAYLTRSLQREPSQDATDRLFSVLSQTVLLEESLPPINASAPIVACALHEASKQALFAQKDGVFQLWRLASDGAWERRWEHQHGALPSGVSFAPEGDRVFVSGHNGCGCYRAEDGEVLKRISVDEGEDWLAVERSPYHREFLAASWKNGASLWDLDSMGLMRQFPTTHVVRARFDVEGQRVVTVSQTSREVQVFAAATGERLAGFQADKELICGDFIPNSDTIYAGTVDGRALVWTLGDDAPPRVLAHEGGRAIRTADVSRDGAQLLTAEGDTVYLWDLASGANRERFLGDSEMLQVAFLGGGHVLAIERAGKLHLREGSGQPQTLDLGGPIHSAEISESLILTGGERQLRFLSWDQRVPSFTLPRCDAQSGGFLEDGKRIWLSDGSKADSSVSLYDAQTGVPLETDESFAVPVDATKQLLGKMRFPFRVTHSAALSADHPVLVGFETGRVIGCDVNRQIEVFEVACHGPITALEWAPSGEFGVVASAHLSGSHDRTLQIIDAQGRVVLGGQWRQASPVTQLAISPNSALVASATPRGDVVVWNVDAGLQLRHWREANASCASLCFAPEGGRLAALFRSKDGSYVRIWNALSGQALSERLWQAGEASGLGFSPDGLRLLVYGRFADVWDVGFEDAFSMAALDHLSAWRLNESGMVDRRPYQKASPEETKTERDRVRSYLEWRALPSLLRQRSPFVSNVWAGYVDALAASGDPSLLQKAVEETGQPLLRAREAALRAFEGDLPEQRAARALMDGVLEESPKSPDIALWDVLLTARLEDWEKGNARAWEVIAQFTPGVEAIKGVLEGFRRVAPQSNTRLILLQHVLDHGMLADEEQLEFVGQRMEMLVDYAFFDEASLDWKQLLARGEGDRLTKELERRLFLMADFRARNISEIDASARLFRLGLLHALVDRALYPETPQEDRVKGLKEELVRLIERDHPPRTVIPAGSDWRFQEARAEGRADWMQLDVDDSAWHVGSGELGFGDGNESTTLPFTGGETLSYHFRRRFHVDGEAALSPLHLRLLYDDGAVVYLDGRELVRRLLPPGSLRWDTLATEGRSGEPEGQFEEIMLKDEVRLAAGEHLLAVSVHQASPNSSDLSFDLELRAPTVPTALKALLGTPSQLEETITALATYYPEDRPEAWLLRKADWPITLTDAFDHWIARQRFRRDLSMPCDPAFAQVIEQALGDEPSLLLEEGLRLLGRTREADSLANRLQWPPAVDLRSEAVDLTAHYNVSVSDDRAWIASRIDRPQWDQLPPPSWDGIPFDVRGAIQLAGASLIQSREGTVFPESVDGIAVDRTAAQVAFLHAVTDGQNSDGNAAAGFRVRYADQSEIEIVLRYGEDCIRSDSSHVPDRHRAIFLPTKGERPFQMTRTVWDNPRPEVKIQSIDFFRVDDRQAVALLGILAQ